MEWDSGVNEELLIFACERSRVDAGREHTVTRMFTPH